MTLPELYPEIWTHIISFVARPKPPLRATAWKDLHQQDLTSMMRVSKLHFQLTAPFLYREPIVEDICSFMESSDLSNLCASDSTSTKQCMTSITPSSTTASNLSLDSTKAYCFQHTRKLHLITLESSFSFKYSTVLFCKEADSRRVFWDNIPHAEQPTAVHVSNLDLNSTIPGINAITLFERELQTLFGLASKCPSHQKLKLRGLSFGAYGDISWNNREGYFEVDCFSVIDHSDDAKLKNERDSIMSNMSNTAHYGRERWGPWLPRVHCNRFSGGPFTSYDLQLYPDDFRPTINFTHVGHTFFRPAVSLGTINIVVFRPDIENVYDHSFDHHERRSWEASIMAMASFLPESVTHERYAGMSTENTRINIYGVPGMNDATASELSRYRKTTQMELDRQLGTLIGAIKLYPYLEAPDCPCCGWSLKMDG